MSEFRMYQLPEFWKSLENTCFSERMRSGGFHEEADYIRDKALDQAEKCLVLVGCVDIYRARPANDDRHPCVILELQP